MQDSQCSLREAVEYVSGSPEPDCGSGFANGVATIIVPAGCFRLSGGLVVSLSSFSPVSSMVITGGGSGSTGCGGGGTVIDAQQTGTVLSISGLSSVALSGVTLTGGLSCGLAVGCDGGGIINAGALSLNDVTIAGNAARAGPDQSTPGAAGGTGHDGGGVYNYPSGRLTVTGSAIIGNVAGGGGAGGDGSGNNGGPGGPGGNGGGIYNAGGVVKLISSTISGNMAGAGGTGGLGDPNTNTQGGSGGAGGDGGGIASVVDVSSAGSLTATNVTVAGNAAGAGGAGALGFPSGGDGSRGGGGGVRASNPALLTNVTIADNAAGGSGDGVDAASGSLTEYGSVIAANGSGPGAQNCVGAVADDGYDVTYPAEGLSDCAGVVADPKLGSLEVNGGPIETMALSTGSAAIDAEPPGGACPAADERGVARPQHARCDSGAYESAPPTLTRVIASASGPRTATVAADVDPHLQHTTVVVHYGTTGAYGASSQTVDAGSSAVAHESVPLTGLTPSTTYHVELMAANADGIARSTDLTLITAASTGSGGGGRGTVAPIVANARQSARRWVAGRTLATFTRKRSPPVGTTFAFELSEPATVTLTFTRPLPGRLVNGRCGTPTSRTRRRPKCTRAIPAGKLTFRGHTRTNRVRFYGRLSQRARLKPGGYTMAIIAINTTGQRSSAKRLTFTIVKP